MEPAQQKEHPDRAALGEAMFTEAICRGTGREMTRCSARAQVTTVCAADPGRRDMLLGLERSRIDIAFIGQLLSEAGDAGTTRTIDAILRRLDDMIVQLSDPGAIAILEGASASAEPQRNAHPCSTARIDAGPEIPGAAQARFDGQRSSAQCDGGARPPRTGARDRLRTAGPCRTCTFCTRPHGTQSA